MAERCQQKRFAGDGNDVVVAYKVWRRWAKAAIVVQKAKGMAAEALGPWLFTLLDGQAALALDAIDIDALAVD